jgi:hypothetical protein
MRGRRTLTTALLLMILSATVILVSSSSTSTGQSEPLTKILITRLGSGYRADDARYAVISPYELEIYQRWGVKWIVFYGPPTRAQTDLVHQYGLKALVYMNALSIEYTEIKGLGYDDGTIKDWAQWGSDCVYVKPPSPDPKIPSCAGDSANQVRISPYSGYQGNNVQGNGYFELVLSPRVSPLVDPAQVNADGIFTDVLFLKPDADSNPHFTTRYNEWKVQNPSGSFQDFRYYSIHYYASRMYGLVKSINPSAIVVTSNNNVFTRSQRDSIALDISRLQDVSDVLLHEWADVDQVDPTSPLNWVNLEINGDPNNNAGLYKVTKPLWSHYLSYQTNRFQTMVNAFGTYNYGYWAYNRYLWDNTYSLDVYVFDTQSSNPVQGATVTLGVTGTSAKSTDGSGHAIFYLRPATYTISITATSYVDWSGQVSISGNTQLSKGLQPQTVTATSTQSSTVYSYRTTTTTVTSYTSTSTSTSTIPTLTTVVLVPLTKTSTIQSIQYLTSILTTTVTSYTGTSASTSTIVVPTTVTIGPSTSTSTVQTTQVLTSTGTTTVTSYTTTTLSSYTGTQTSTSAVPTLTTVVLVPLTMTSTVRSTQYLTSILTTTVTSYTGTQTWTSTVVVPATVVLVPLTTTSTVQSTQLLTSIVTTTVTSYTATTTSRSTSVVYTTVTASLGGAGAGPSSPLAYLGFISLLAVTVAHRVTAAKGRIPKVRSLMERRCPRS